MTAHSVELVEASPAFAAVLAALHREGFPDPWSQEAFSDLLAQPNVHCWVATNPDPVGFILVRTAADEAEVLTLAVIPRNRRTGIGRTLIEQVLTWLDLADAKVCHLEVAADNMAAHRLYTQSCFAESGRRKGYYRRHGEEGRAVDAVLMTRPI